MPPDELREVLLRAVPPLGLAPTEHQIEALFSYLTLLGRWGKVYNITAAPEPREMLAHMLDCLAAVEPLRRRCGERFRLLDVGSGGGLPGLIIAILLPEATIACVDSVGKKAAFMRQAALELKLTNVAVAHARVERFVAEPFDVVASRAFASLADFATLTRTQLADSGLWMAMKGRLSREELAAVPRHLASVFHVEPLNVPLLAAERCLVWMRPVLTKHDYTSRSLTTDGIR